MNVFDKKPLFLWGQIHGKKFWSITGADRPITAVLRPSAYEGGLK